MQREGIFGNEKTIITSVIIVTFFSFVTPLTTNVHAAIFTQLYSNEQFIPMSDVIVKKYRRNNGIIQYRHWNETGKCWVEDYWITMG